MSWDRSGLLRPVESEHGPLGVGLVLAHEWAHVAQSQGLPWGERTVEEQADCLARAWARQAADAGELEPVPGEAEVSAAERGLETVACSARDALQAEP